ncbi:MAG: SDR family oxidoreductase [Burkholderiaceae bacterium]
MAELENRVAIVTGGAAGFGAGIVERYVAEGARVVFADINAQAGEALAARLGDAAVFVRCDVSNEQDIKNVAQTTFDRFGVPDIVVNNAGITHRNQSLLSVDLDTFRRLIDVNVVAIYLMTQAVVPAMIERGSGVILNVGSTAGIRPRPGLTWYNATKGMVNTLSKSMAVELGEKGIRVNAICPVMGETGLLEAFMGVPDTPENRKRFIATIPLGRLSTPADVAEAAVFLGSDRANFISGVEFPVDGGRTV